MRNQARIFRYRHFWAYFTGLPSGGLKKPVWKRIILSGRGMTPPDLFHILQAACTLEFLINVFMVFLFGIPIQVVVHKEPLPKGFMDGQAQHIVQLRQAYEQNDGPVTGIYLKIERDF